MQTGLPRLDSNEDLWSLNMIYVPGGEFTMGSDDHYAEEAPAHRVKVDGFWIDARR